MKFSLWTFAVAASSLAIGEVYACEFSSENALTTLNGDSLDNESLNSFLGSRFSSSEIELITSNPNDKEWFQELSTAKNQLNVEIALAIGIAIQNAFSEEVMRIVLKHIAKSFHSLPELILPEVSDKIFKLAVEIKDFESCSVLLQNNSKTFVNVFNALKIEEGAEIVKLINGSSLEMSLNDLTKSDGSGNFNLFFYLIYSKIPDELFLESFIDFFKMSKYYFISSFSFLFFIDDKEFIERFLNFCENLKSVYESQTDYDSLNVLIEACAVVSLLRKINESSETGEFDKVIELFKSEIENSNISQYSGTTFLLGLQLAAVDSASFINLYESNTDFFKNIPEDFIENIKNPNSFASVQNELLIQSSFENYNFKSFNLDENQNFTFEFTLRENLSRISMVTLPKKYKYQIKLSQSYDIQNLIISLFNWIPDLDEQKIFEYFTFISQNSSLDIVNIIYYSPSIELMKVIAFSTRLNDFFMSRKIVLKPQIHVIAELIKYSASTNSKIVLDKSVCNFYSNEFTTGYNCKFFAHYKLYKYFHLKVHFEILESLTGFSFSEYYLSKMNEMCKDSSNSEIEFHEFRIAFKDWMSGPLSNYLKSIKNGELY